MGHSLGAGVAGLFTMLLIGKPELVGLSNANDIRSFLFAPPRVMSIDLTMKYAPHISSVIYQASSMTLRFFARVEYRAENREQT